MEVDVEINLLDPAAYQGSLPWEQFRWLRNNAPFYWHQGPEGEADFWAVTRYEDVKAIENDWASFSAEPSTTYWDGSSPGDDANHKHLIMSDAPHHTAHREFLSPEFRAVSVGKREPHLNGTVADVVDEVIEDGQCDLVWDLSGKMASYVIADLLGLSREESLELFHAADILTRGVSLEEGKGQEAMTTVFTHAGAAWQARQENPTADLLGRIAQGSILDVPIDQMQFSIDFLLMVAAGSDTTRNTFAGGMLALLETPGQWELLKSRPELIPSAVEEMLRWTAPVVYQCRRATRDTIIGGQEIKAGEKVAAYMSSACRDESVFASPDTFDITRFPNPHVAFGWGKHFCLGVHLARAELSAMLREVVVRMPDISLDGPIGWIDYPVPPAVFGIESIPVRFSPGPKSSSAVPSP